MKKTWYEHLSEWVTTEIPVVSKLLAIQYESWQLIIEVLQDPNEQYINYVKTWQFQKALELCYTILVFEYNKIDQALKWKISISWNFETLVWITNVWNKWIKRLKDVKWKVISKADEFASELKIKFDKNELKPFSSLYLEYLVSIYGSKNTINYYNSISWLIKQKSYVELNVWLSNDLRKIIDTSQWLFLSIIIWNLLYNYAKISWEFSTKINFNTLDPNIKQVYSKFSLTTKKSKKKVKKTGKK